MNIIIADDEPLALEMTCEAVREVCPKANIYPFSKPSRLLEFAKETRCKIAFLDICMRGVSGIDVAKQKLFRTLILSLLQDMMSTQKTQWQYMPAVILKNQ